MGTVGDYVARIEEACGEERNFIVVFKYSLKDDAITKILKKAKTEKSFSKMIFDLTFGDISFRLYKTGKAIFQDLKGKEELQKVLADLLL